MFISHGGQLWRSPNLCFSFHFPLAKNLERKPLALPKGTAGCCTIPLVILRTTRETKFTLAPCLPPSPGSSALPEGLCSTHLLLPLLGSEPCRQCGATGFLLGCGFCAPTLRTDGRQTAQPLCPSHVIVRAGLTQTSPPTPSPRIRFQSSC